MLKYTYPPSYWKCAGSQIEKDTDGDTDTALIDLQADQSSLNFIDDMEAAQLSEMIRAELVTLSDRERNVIELFYFENKSLQEIAKQLNVSGERARQLRSRAERTLRDNKTLHKIYNEYYKQRATRKKYF